MNTNSINQNFGLGKDILKRCEGRYNGTYHKTNHTNINIRRNPLLGEGYKQHEIAFVRNLTPGPTRNDKSIFTKRSTNQLEKGRNDGEFKNSQQVSFNTTMETSLWRPCKR